MRPSFRRFVQISAIAVGFGCSDAMAVMAGAAPDTPAARVDANTPASTWSGVVSILANGSVYSGVLIGTRHVLTAGHVFDPNPVATAVSVQFNLGGAPIIVPALRYMKHPDYISFGNPNTQNDLAIIELAANAPAGAAIYPLATRVPSAGTTATLVGYGGSGNGDAGVTVNRAADVKRVGKNALDAFDADAKGSGKMMVYYFDFDGPNAGSNIVGAGTLGNAIETTLAGGDSGCPAFVQEAGIWKVAGINTFTSTMVGGATVASTFGTLGGGQVVASQATWINSVINAADSDVPEFGALGASGAAALVALSLALRQRDSRCVRDSKTR